jgi:hypothetical protein
MHNACLCCWAVTLTSRLCRGEITRGVRTQAANWVAAEAALKQGAAAARGVFGSHVLPAARRGAPAIRGMRLFECPSCFLPSITIVLQLG